jgi:hypothetical protein
MAFFNFIETFFFLSLGITFVLILLLVYHFKERIGTVEKKSESLLEIINNMVKEMNNLRNSHLQLHAAQFDTQRMFSAQPLPAAVLHPPSGLEEVSVEKIKVNITENDDSSDDDSDYDTETDTEMCEDDDDDVPALVSDDIDDSLLGLQSIDDIENMTNTVKVIQYDVENAVLKDVFTEEFVEVDADIMENGCEEELQPLSLDASNTIQIEKLGENLETFEERSSTEVAATTSDVLSMTPIQPTKSVVDTEIYRKMNIQALKTHVITKGLCSDPSKMKKGELLKLIETEMMSSKIEQVSEDNPYTC